MTSTETTAQPRAQRPRRIVLFLIIAGFALGLDVLTKVLAVASLEPGETKRILGGAIWLDLARNSGAAFSLGTGFTVILTVLALAIVGVIVRTARRMRSVGWAVSLGLILGGALGNLGDRLFRSPGVLRGHVIDFISLFGPGGEHWPIFNLADSAVTCGAVLAGVLAVIGIGLDGAKHTDKGPTDGRADTSLASGPTTSADEHPADHG